MAGHSGADAAGTGGDGADGHAGQGATGGDGPTGGNTNQAGAGANRDAAVGDGDAAIDEMEPEPCEVVAPRSCDDPSLTYADIEPIIHERCVHCHDGTGENWALLSYSHVADWYDTIRAMMLTCGMPPPESGETMPNAERDTILMWIRCGFKP